MFKAYYWLYVNYFKLVKAGFAVACKIYAIIHKETQLSLLLSFFST